MTDEQKNTATVYASIPLQARLTIFNDLVAYAETLSEPLVRAGVMFAAGRFVHQATRLEREKRRKSS